MIKELELQIKKQEWNKELMISYQFQKRKKAKRRLLSQGKMLTEIYNHPYWFYFFV